MFHKEKPEFQRLLLQFQPSECESDFCMITYTGPLTSTAVSQFQALHISVHTMTGSPSTRSTMLNMQCSGSWRRELKNAVLQHPSKVQTCNYMDWACQMCRCLNQSPIKSIQIWVWRRSSSIFHKSKSWINCVWWGRKPGMTQFLWEYLTQTCV